MKILVIGLGSMGKRRIRLIKSVKPNFTVIGFDQSLSRCAETASIYNIDTYNDWEDVQKHLDIEAAFICTAPLSHSELIRKCLMSHWNVFTELNLVEDGYDENIELAKLQKKVLFLSSTMLYRNELKCVDEIVKSSKDRLNYNYHVGQYLPDWHPWENYKDFFVGDKRSNGCREIFAIELPWLVSAFGPIKHIQKYCSKKSHLDIAYPDSFHVIIEHESGHSGVLMVDVISRKASRDLKICGEQVFLIWNGSPEGFMQYNTVDGNFETINCYDEIERTEGYNKFIVENAYLQEIEHFFECLEGKSSPIYTFKDDLEVLKWINYIES